MLQSKQFLFKELCKAGLKQKPGWFNILAYGGFTENDIKEIEEKEDFELGMTDKIERKMKNEVKEKERELIKETTEFNPGWVKERKMMFFEKEIGRLEKEMKSIYEDNILLRNQKIPLWFRKCLINTKELYEKEKEIKNLKMRIRIIKYPIKDNDITPEMIAQARSYPIDKIIDVKRNKALCLFHDDHNPSMHIYPKTNTGYCFTCNTYHDVIDICMKKYNMKFVEAVKFLVGGENA